jgi:hypothetical protein
MSEMTAMKLGRSTEDNDVFANGGSGKKERERRTRNIVMSHGGMMCKWSMPLVTLIRLKRVFV